MGGGLEESSRGWQPTDPNCSTHYTSIGNCIPPLSSPPDTPSLPPWKVDVALITHFHLDHCAAVPYLLQKTKFKV